jgi:hypothetical protein
MHVSGLSSRQQIPGLFWNPKFIATFTVSGPHPVPDESTPHPAPVYLYRFWYDSVAGVARSVVLVTSDWDCITSAFGPAPGSGDKSAWA